MSITLCRCLERHMLESLFAARKSGPKWTCHFKLVHRLKKRLFEGKEKIGPKVAWKLGVVGQNLVPRLLRIKIRRPKNGQSQSAMS
jgi:hypothetical protein